MSVFRFSEETHAQGLQEFRSAPPLNTEYDLPLRGLQCIGICRASLSPAIMSQPSGGDSAVNSLRIRCAIVAKLLRARCESIAFPLSAPQR